MNTIISRESDYAIRIVAYMAGVKRQVKITELVDNLFLSKSIVIKIIQKLKKCGIVVTKTGKNGGLSLVDTVDEITIYQILNCMGFKSTINICAVRPVICELNPICDITNFFIDIQKDFERKLKSARIKDFVFNEDEILELKSKI